MITLKPVFSDFEIDMHLKLKDGDIIYNVTEEESKEEIQKGNLEFKFWTIFGRYANHDLRNGREEIIDVFDEMQAFGLLNLLEAIKKTNEDNGIDYYESEDS